MISPSASFSEVEMGVYRSGKLPDCITPESVAFMFREVFPYGCVLANSARELWRALIVSYCSLKCVKPTVSMPSGICSGMVEAIADYASVDLYDNLAETDGSQGRFVSSNAGHADFVLVGNLGGKREAIPGRRCDAQLIVDDACQCSDGVCGFRDAADYCLFSFGYDKPLFAGGGGVIGVCNTNGRGYSARDMINLSAVEALIPYQVADWRAYLMISQLMKSRG